MLIPSCRKTFFIVRFFRGELMEDLGQVNLRLDKFLKNHNRYYCFIRTFIILNFKI